MADCGGLFGSRASCSDLSGCHIISIFQRGGYTSLVVHFQNMSLFSFGRRRFEDCRWKFCPSYLGHGLDDSCMVAGYTRLPFCGESDLGCSGRCTLRPPGSLHTLLCRWRLGSGDAMLDDPSSRDLNGGRDRGGDRDGGLGRSVLLGGLGLLCHPVARLALPRTRAPDARPRVPTTHVCCHGSSSSAPFDVMDRDGRASGA
mmetsp:Transcript_69605/g.145134  ORF Transcript_69605/g.145134 Transcript_69605/m.145134 type:complete len:201 (+) Transcript_69605:191-793(+)